MDLGDHKHCSKCVDQACSKDHSFVGFGEDSCEVIDCSNYCGARLHHCKLEDHLMHVCRRALVFCPNNENGCLQKMLRSKVVSHLQHCPASVVTCSLEWNRWKRSAIPDADLNSCCDIFDTLHEQQLSEVLDVALAQRDQRMLDKALHMPPKLRRALRNSYTLNFPAVPFTQRPSSLTEGDGMDSSVDSLDLDTPSEPCEWEVSQNPPGYVVPAVHCSLCKKRQDAEVNGLAKSITDSLNRVKTNQDSGNWVCYSTEVTSAEKTSSSDELGSVVKPRQSSGCKVNLVMEMFNSFRSKPMKMLTFLCAQDFRRDEYSQHYKNVHCDIQSGLDGWFQVRCPLAVYGCQYTYQRFTGASGEKVVFNPLLESFGVRPIQADENESQKFGEDHLSALPVELLLHIQTFLDPFSLFNLSLTSKVIRHTCEHMINTKGMVILDWHKDANDGRWRVAQKIWSFSKAFHKMQSWKFAARKSENVSNHLRVCPYNIRRHHEREKYLIFAAASSVQ